MNFGLLDVKLKEYLLAKGYSPGDKIPTETELASFFKVGRSRIREASLALCHTGILEKRPRRGTVIKSLNPGDIGRDLKFRFQMAAMDSSDFREARLVIEAAIIPLVVRRMTPSLLNRLRKSVELMEQGSTDLADADKADRDFHLTLLDACGNSTLQAFGGVIYELFADEHRAIYRRKEMVARAAQYHRAILEAIVNEDAQKAVELMREHFADLK